MSAVLEKIKTRGYWEISIRPAQYEKHRVLKIQRLLPLIQQAAVDLTGWDFPHIDRRNSPTIGLDWIQSAVDWEHYVEEWRLYQSGQFLYFGGIDDDWTDQSSLAMASYPPEAYLPVTRTVIKYTLAFELASRLSTTELGADAMTVGIDLVGLSGRKLRMDNPDRCGFFSAPTASLARWHQAEAFSRERLVSEARELAIEWVENLFARFDWTPGVDLLRAVQGDGLRRS